MTGIPGQAWPPVSAQPYPGQPYPMQYASPPMPPKRNGGKIAAIVIGTMVLACALCAGVGALAWPSFKQGFDQAMASASASPSSKSKDITAVPATGLCYTSATLDSRGWHQGAEADKLVPCTGLHDFETVATGTYPSQYVVQPSTTSTATGDLYTQCSDAVDAYLGQPWAGTYTWAVLSVPSASAWSKGAHWYRCDVVSSDGVGNMKEKSTTGSIKDSVKPIDCLIWSLDSSGNISGDLRGADCAGVHNGEMIGAGPMPDSVDRTDREAVEAAVGQTCGPFITSYLGTQDLAQGLWLSYFAPRQKRASGQLDQNILCIVGPEDLKRTLKGSLKGLGDGPIPFAN